MMEPSLSWEILLETDGSTKVTLKGDVTETSSLTALAPRLAGVVALDLAGVRRVNSAGVREWIDFMTALGPNVSKLSFLRCSVAIVHQLNMIDGFRGGARVVSAYAPYFCVACNSEHNELIDLSAPGPVELRETLECPKCQGEAELDELPEYLSFHES